MVYGTSRIKAIASRLITKNFSVLTYFVCIRFVTLNMFDLSLLKCFNNLNHLVICLDQAIELTISKTM
ncbi:hypothetical protein HDE68_004898 [Pedobacter cryoconitis]|uniref:Uncharacterized protein n=1 Tax=Pedobacter cryoconitis TaxID=188932 RepID=A0A7W8ZS50_9SPHI|nr:hypothetical protein [Pedobacter cryoconitis]